MDYYRGLRMLKARLPKSAVVDLNLFEARLRENLDSERRYGSSEALRTERAVIVGHLNELSQTYLDISFNELCLQQRDRETITSIPRVRDAQNGFIGPDPRPNLARGNRDVPGLRRGSPYSLPLVLLTGLLGFLIGILGNLIAGWIQQDIMRGSFTPAGITAILVLTIFGVGFGAWIQAHNATTKTR